MGYSTPSPNGATWDLTGSIYSSLGGWNQPGLVVYQESHDEERLQYNNEQYGNSSGTYSIKDTATGLARDAMATAFWALAPGPKMLTEFSELGYDYSINWCPNGTVDASGTCRTDAKPIRWDYLRDSSRRKLHDVYAALLALRGAYPALATGTVSYSLAGNVKYLSVVSGTLSAMVVGNFDVVTASASVPFTSAGTWYDLLSTKKITATGSAQQVMLAPGEYHVYLSKDLNPADTAVIDTTAAPVAGVSVAVCPNPVVSSGTTIRYALPVAGDALLEIYSLRGARVAAFDMGNQAAGKYSIQAGLFPLDPAALPNGYYVLKLVSAGGTAHVPFVVVRP
jgi:hypothetical protein